MTLTLFSSLLCLLVSSANSLQNPVSILHLVMCSWWWYLLASSSSFLSVSTVDCRELTCLVCSDMLTPFSCVIFFTISSSSFCVATLGHAVGGAVQLVKYLFFFVVQLLQGFSEIVCIFFHFQGPVQQWGFCWALWDERNDCHTTLFWTSLKDRFAKWWVQCPIVLHACYPAIQRVSWALLSFSLFCLDPPAGFTD